MNEGNLNNENNSVQPEVNVQPTEPVVPTQPVQQPVQPVAPTQPIQSEQPAQSVVEQPPKKKGGAIIVIIVLLLLVLIMAIAVVVVLFVLKPNGGKSDNGNGNSTSVTAITTEVNNNTGKVLEAYIYTYVDDVNEKRYLFTDSAHASGERQKVEIKCQSNDCSFAGAQYWVTEEEKLFAIIEDGKSFFAVNKDGNYIAKDIGSDLVKDGKKLYFEDPAFGVTESGIYYAGANVGEEGSVVFNINNNTHSGIIKDADLEWCEDSLCGISVLDLFVIPTDMSEDNIGSKVYNLETGKIDFEVDGFLDLYKSGDVYYFTTTSKTYDTKGNVIANVGISGNCDDSLYTIENNKLQMRNSKFEVVKEVDSIDKFVMSGKGFVVALSTSKLQLFDQDLNLYTTLMENYNDKDYYIDTYSSGWWTNEGETEEGIFVIVDVVTNGAIEQFKKDNPQLNYSDDDDIYCYEYYYYPNSKKTGRIATIYEE